MARNYEVRSEVHELWRPVDPDCVTRLSSLAHWGPLGGLRWRAGLRADCVSEYLCPQPDRAHRSVPPAPRSPSHLKPPLGPHSATLPSSPEPLGMPASAPLPRANGGFQAPPHQLPEAHKSPQSLSKKKKRNRLGEAQGQGSEMGKAVVAPPGKRRRRKRKRPEDSDTCPPQEGQHWSPERRKEGRAEPPVARLEGEGGR